MSLTDSRIRAAKPQAKPYKLSDEKGLLLLVTPRGARLWRWRYRYVGRENMLSLGAYPEITLAQARDRRDESRKVLAQGIDPACVKSEARESKHVTFEAITREWLERQQFAPKTRAKADWMLDDLILPYLGRRPIRELTAPEILAAVRRIESRGKHETAHRCKWRIGQIIRYAVATGRADRDPTSDLRGALKPVRTINRAAITAPHRVGQLLVAIDSYSGQYTTAAALKLAPLLFVRPGELRAAEWSEFDLDCAQPEWRIPAARMKMREEHVVPLARQAVDVLRDLQPLTGRGKLLFPSLVSRLRPISDNTLNLALRRLGYGKDEMTAHGFRATASTLLNETGFPPDIIERQLAHAERNKVRAAYNRAQRLNERRDMMQKWADYLDVLRSSALNPKVVPIWKRVAER